MEDLKLMKGFSTSQKTKERSWKNKEELVLIRENQWRMLAVVSNIPVWALLSYINISMVLDLIVQFTTFSALSLSLSLSLSLYQVV